MEYASSDVRRNLAHYDHSSILTYETSGAYVAGADLAQVGGDRLVASTTEALATLRAEEAALIRVARNLGIDEGMPSALLEAMGMGLEARSI